MGAIKRKCDKTQAQTELIPNSYRTHTELLPNSYRTPGELVPGPHRILQTSCGSLGHQNVHGQNIQTLCKVHLLALLPPQAQCWGSAGGPLANGQNIQTPVVILRAVFNIEGQGDGGWVVNALPPGVWIFCPSSVYHTFYDIIGAKAHAYSCSAGC